MNKRELEVICIIAKAGTPLTSTQIVMQKKELTQSTVQAVLRILLKRGDVDTVGVTHSGNVLSRTFAITEKGKEHILNDLLDHYRMISSVVSVNEVVTALQQIENV